MFGTFNNDLVYKNDKNYYSHTLLEECRYKV